MWDRQYECDLSGAIPDEAGLWIVPDALIVPSDASTVLTVNYPHQPYIKSTKRRSASMILHKVRLKGLTITRGKHSRRGQCRFGCPDLVSYSFADAATYQPGYKSDCDYSCEFLHGLCFPIENCWVNCITGKRRIQL
jgi:hypothetical protein